MSRVSRGNGYSVYGLYDPRDKHHRIRYFGSTKQTVKKRVSDHESETRFFNDPANRAKYGRDGLPAPIKNEWIQGILDAGHSVGYVTIAHGLSHDDACDLEATLIKTITDPVNWSLTTAKDKQSAARLKQERANAVKHRAALGYPRPDLSSLAPENTAHRAHIISTRRSAAMARQRQARIAALVPLFERIMKGEDAVLKKNGKVNVGRTLAKHNIRGCDWDHWLRNR
jgi:hypothetical protein